MIAISCQLDFSDGRRVWVPAQGRPFWSHGPITGYLSDAEIARYVTPYLGPAWARQTLSLQKETTPCSTASSAGCGPA